MTDQHPPALETQVALLAQEVDALKLVVEQQTKVLTSLNNAWQSATGILAFLKTLAAVVAAAGGIAAIIKLKLAAGGHQ